MNAPANAALPFSCAGCDQRFATKGAKLRHKKSCGTKRPADVEQFERCADEDLYARFRSTPQARAYAAAEWDAMDDEGRLPPGWVNPIPLPRAA